MELAEQWRSFDKMQRLQSCQYLPIFDKPFVLRRVRQTISHGDLRTSLLSKATRTIRVLVKSTVRQITAGILRTEFACQHFF